MTQKFGYLAIDPDGVKHKRRSDRTYTHTVVYKGGYARAVASVEDQAWAITDQNNYRYYLDIVEGRTGKAPWETEAQHEARKGDAAGHLAGCQCAADYIAKCKAHRLARIEANRAEGKYDTWQNAGWCGRSDLAQKVASDWSSKGFQVEILEIVQK
jgi:hypothetical protein